MAAAAMDVCSNCHEPVEYWQVRCRCEQFLGFPHRRMAEDERVALRDRHDAATLDCEARGVTRLLDALENLAEMSRPVIAMPFEACDLVLCMDKYRNYHQRVAAGERPPARPGDHGDRDMVRARLFPMFDEHIVYAVLSPDGSGPQSYGEVMVRWEVTPHYLGQRAILLEENSYHLYDRHQLGPRGAELPPGVPGDLGR